MLPAGAQESVSTESQPGRSSLTPLESLSSDSAQARWNRAKARYQPLAADIGTEAVPTAKVVATAPAATVQQSFRPIPLDMDEPVATAQAPELPLLPDGADEPAWVVTASPVPAPVPAPPAAPAPRVLTSRSSSGFPAAGAIPRQPAPPMPVMEQSQGTLDRSLPAEPLQVAVAQAETAIPPLPETQGPTGGAPATRPVRKIGDIQPFYDKSVDEDIREYAEARASEYDVSFPTEVYEPRMFPDTAMAWEPSNLYHYPLYFEDVALERYGHTYPFVVQPFVSVAKFSGQLLSLPYQMTLDPVDKPMYALGYYRPGEVAPKLKYQIPLNAQAAATQAAVTTGLFYLIP